MPAPPAYATVRPSPGPAVAVALAVVAVIAGAWAVRLACAPAAGPDRCEMWLDAPEVAEPEALIAGGP